MAKNSHASDNRIAPNRDADPRSAASTSTSTNDIGPIEDVFSERTPPQLANRGRKMGSERAHIGLTAVRSGATQTPGMFLRRVSRSLAHRDGLWLVAGSREVAVRIVDLLKHPVQWTTDQEVRLYTTREVLRTEGGQEVVHPAPDNPVKWLLTPDGQLRLTTGNRTVGTTTVAQTNPIETVDLPRLIPTAAVGDSTVWAVLDANGDMITRYQDRQSLFSDWQLVRPAFVPTRLMYIDAVCVYIPDPEEPGLIPCRLHRGIDYGVREMRDSMRTFLDMYTAHQAGQHLPADTVRDWWQAWISAQRDESPPRDNWFKRTLQDALCIDSHNGTRRITDRTWAYPRRDAPR